MESALGFDIQWNLSLKWWWWKKTATAQEGHVYAEVRRAGRSWESWSKGVQLRDNRWEVKLDGQEELWVAGSLGVSLEVWKRVCGKFKWEGFFCRRVEEGLEVRTVKRAKYTIWKSCRGGNFPSGKVNRCTVGVGGGLWGNMMTRSQMLWGRRGSEIRPSGTRGIEGVSHLPLLTASSSRVLKIPAWEQQYMQRTTTSFFILHQSLISKGQRMWVTFYVSGQLVPVQKLEQLWHVHPWKTPTLSWRTPWLIWSSICNSSASS